MRLAEGFGSVGPMTAAGVSPIAGAMQQAPQYYQQMVINKFLNPMLQQALAQEQQTTQQMTAATPYAAQFAQNTALGMPMETMMQLMQNPKFVATNPGLAKQMAGYLVQKFAMSAPQPSGASPTVPLPLGATSTINPVTGQPIQSANVPTIPSTIGSWVGGLGKSIGDELQKIRGSVGKNTGFNTATASTPAPMPQTSGSDFSSTPGSSMQSGVTGQQPMSNTSSHPLGSKKTFKNNDGSMGLAQWDGHGWKRMD